MARSDLSTARKIALAVPALVNAAIVGGLSVFMPMTGAKYYALHSGESEAEADWYVGGAGTLFFMGYLLVNFTDEDLYINYRDKIGDKSTYQQIIFSAKNFGPALFQAATALKELEVCKREQEQEELAGLAGGDYSL